MTSVGETLRCERLRRGFELEQISRELKISSRFLEAIEADDFKKLPGGVFAKSFVRQYARLLSLDEEELAGEVQRRVEPEPVAVPVKEPQRVAAPEIHLPRVEEWRGGGERRSFLPALAMVVVVMLVCSGIYTWWQRKSQQVSAHEQTASVAQPLVTPPQPQAQEPAQTAPPPQAQAAAPASEPGSEPVSAPAVQAPAVQAPAAQSQAPPPAPVNSADRPAGEPAAQTPPIKSVAQTPKGPVRLELTADEPVWVLAQANGKFLFSGTLEPHQTRTVEAAGMVVLRLGNAGGVMITLNGKSLGAVGPKGQVRTVQFTSGGFQIVAAASSPVSFDPLDRL
jgi:cytoskeleton protein RodZ